MNANIHTSSEIESTSTVFEWAKTIHALNSVAAVIGVYHYNSQIHVNLHFKLSCIMVGFNSQSGAYWNGMQVLAWKCERTLINTNKQCT
jgi:hypothetical protein